MKIEKSNIINDVISMIVILAFIFGLTMFVLSVIAFIYRNQELAVNNCIGNGYNIEYCKRMAR